MRPDRTKSFRIKCGVISSELEVNENGLILKQTDVFWLDVEVADFFLSVKIVQSGGDLEEITLKVLRVDFWETGVELLEDVWTQARQIQLTEVLVSILHALIESEGLNDVRVVERL